MSIEQIADARGISRICHLTPFRNLVHLACGEGLLSLTELARRSGDYDPQDLERLDGHPDHISCSIEYPNGWYLRQRRLRATPLQRLFPDWVCLIIEPAALWAEGTRVCVRNASAQNGALVRDISPENLDALYVSEVIGSGGRTYRRSAQRLTACPTDDQAELLVKRQIPWSAVRQIVVASEGDAQRMHAGLAQIGAKLPPSWAVAPVLFTASPLSSAIAQGRRPPETPWEPGNA